MRMDEWMKYLFIIFYFETVLIESLNNNNYIETD